MGAAKEEALPAPGGEPGEEGFEAARAILAMVEEDRRLFGLPLRGAPEGLGAFGIVGGEGKGQKARVPLEEAETSRIVDEERLEGDFRRIEAEEGESTESEAAIGGLVATAPAGDRDEDIAPLPESPKEDLIERGLLAEEDGNLPGNAGEEGTAGPIPAGAPDLLVIGPDVGDDDETRPEPPGRQRLQLGGDGAVFDDDGLRRGKPVQPPAQLPDMPSLGAKNRPGPGGRDLRGDDAGEAGPTGEPQRAEARRQQADEAALSPRSCDNDGTARSRQRLSLLFPDSKGAADRAAPLD